MGRKACKEPQCLYKGALYLTLDRQKDGQTDTKKLIVVSRNFSNTRRND